MPVLNTTVPRLSKAAYCFGTRRTNCQSHYAWKAEDLERVVPFEIHLLGDLLDVFAAISAGDSWQIRGTQYFQMVERIF